MNSLKDILRVLSSIPAPSGREHKCSNFIENYLIDIGYRTEMDYFGNVSGIIEKGKGKTLVFDAHIDNIFMYVKDIKKGYIMIDARGIDSKILKGKEVEVITKKGILKGIIGMIPPHIRKKEDKEILYVDIGEFYPSSETPVNIGDFVVYHSKFKELLNNRIAGRSFDNRASCAVLLYLARDLKELDFKGKVILYFSVQEEISAQGASIMVKKHKPDYVICIDVTFANSDFDDQNTVELGKGPAIGVGPFISRFLREKLIKIAEEGKIPYQIEVLESNTHTNLDKIFLKNGGVPSALVSIPLRYMHSPNEVCDLKDLQKTYELLKNFIKEILR